MGFRMKNPQRVQGLIASLVRVRLFSKNTLDLGNGDFILVYRQRVSRNTSGFRGPFVTLGHERSIDVALRGKNVITAHEMRVLFHKRARHEEYLSRSSSATGATSPSHTQSS